MLQSPALPNDKHATPNACDCSRSTQTVHLSAPWESAGREAQLARVRQKQKSLARRLSGHEHTQCEGEGAVFCGICGHLGKRSEDDGFHNRCQRLSRPVQQRSGTQHKMLTSGLHGRKRTEQHVIELSVGCTSGNSGSEIVLFVHGFKSGHVMS